MLTRGFVCAVFATLFSTTSTWAQEAVQTAAHAVVSPKAARAAFQKKRRVVDPVASFATPARPSPVPNPELFGFLTFAEAKANGLGRLDSSYAYKGWNIRFPSQGNSVLQDIGGVRSGLDKYGIGVVELNTQTYSQNVLDTPLKTPQAYPPSTNRGTVAAGNQVYNGERPTFVNASTLFVTFDTSRLGVPDGQIDVAVSKYNSTWQPLAPNLLAVTTLSYFQTAFDRKLEIEVGIFSNITRFAGINVGENFASTFGPAASIAVLLGLSYYPTPAANFKWNVTDRLYSKLSIERSDPVNGPTGNPIYDGEKENPTGLTFSLPDDGLFVVDEIGYRNAAAPGDPQTWVRAGGMYNNSRFRDFRMIATNPTATIKGSSGIYVLGDRQLLQTTPGEASASRGLYVGGTFQYAPERTTPISQYYEGRIYAIGPFDSRPTDLVSFVYNHQVFSSYVPDQVNPIAESAAELGVSIPLARHASNAYIISYLAHLAPGIYVSTGLAYTDHPSALYFKGEGSALNVLGGIVTVF